MTNYKPNSAFPPNSSDESSIEPTIEEIGYRLNEAISNLDDLLYQKCFNIPFTSKVIVDEKELTDQLEDIRKNIPDTIRQAIEVLEDRDNIMREAEVYAQNLVNNAKRDAAQEINESTIVQQANFEAGQIRRQVLKECQEKRRATELEVEQMYEEARRKAKYVEERAFADAESIQNQADDYADQVLYELEKEIEVALKRVVTVINQRQQNSNFSDPSSAISSTPPNISSS